MRLTMRQFGVLVRRVMETLPPEFEPHLHNVVVDIAREPSEQLLLKAGFTPAEIEDGETLLGLFEPLDMPSMFGGDSVDLNDLQHRLWIFKNPHEDEFPDPKQLRIEIRKTVIHELAHHFGWTDRDLEKFDDTPNPFGDNE